VFQPDRTTWNPGNSTAGPEYQATDPLGKRRAIANFRLELGDEDRVNTYAGPVAGQRRRAAANWTRELLQDIKSGWRRTTGAPGFAAVAVVLLAVAIGTNTALFSVVEALILRPTPHAEPEELVDIRLIGSEPNIGTFAYPTFRDLENATGGAFDGVAGAAQNVIRLEDGTGTDYSPNHELVAGPFFDVMGVGAQLGRVFGPGEDTTAGGNPVVVLSDDTWRREFDGDPGILNRTIRLNGFPYTIVGVAVPGFYGAFRETRPALWVHVSHADQIALNGPGSLETRRSRSFKVVGRLADDVTLADAELVVGEFAGYLEANCPEFYRNHRIEVTRTFESAVHPTVDRAIVPVATLATGVLAILLLLACLNLASMLVARSETRRNELAVHLALGAGRKRLVRSFLIEGSVLALLGGALGVYLSALLIEFIASVEVRAAIPFTIDARLNGTVLAFALCMSVLAGLLVASGPAMQSAHHGISAILKEGPAPGSGGTLRVRHAILAIQVAAAAILIVAAGMLVRSWAGARQIDPGFGDHAAVIVPLAPGPSRPQGERRAFYDNYLQGVRDIPGVVSAGTAPFVPLRATSTSVLSIAIPGVDPPAEEDGLRVDWTPVGGDYFDAMGIPLLAGRPFDSGDDTGSGTVAIVSRTMAERFWPGLDAVGQQVDLCGGRGCWATVVGVVGDVRVRTLFEPFRPFMYTPAAQSPYGVGSVVARTTGNPAELLPAMLALATELDPNAITRNARTMEKHLSLTLIPARIVVVLLGAIGTFALLLAVVGIYAMVGYSVTARSRELTIRISVGATPRQLVTSVVRSTMGLVAVGLAAGLLLAAAAAHVTWDSPQWMTAPNGFDYAAAVMLLAALGGSAAHLSARNATRVDPAQALSPR